MQYRKELLLIYKEAISNIIDIAIEKNTNLSMKSLNDVIQEVYAYTISENPLIPDPKFINYLLEKKK
jgi:hypothetical protein